MRMVGLVFAAGFGLALCVGPAAFAATDSTGPASSSHRHDTAKGAAAGAVVGHEMGHGHALAGAATGAAIGHHEKNKAAKTNW